MADRRSKTSSLRNKPAWREGYKAYDEGMWLNHNPHHPESLSFAYWHDGWIAARDDLQDHENDTGV